MEERAGRGRGHDNSRFKIKTAYNMNERGKKKKKAMQRQYLSTFHKQTDEAQPIRLSPPAVLEDKNPFFF